MTAPKNDATPPDDSGHRSPLDAIEVALGAIPLRQSVTLPRWLGWLAVSSSVGMLPWLVYLGFTLPAKVHSNNYDIAWLGFDSALVLILGALAYCAIRRRPATGLFAAAATAMLLVDAWFDVTTSDSPKSFVIALVLALVAEIPLAIICGWAAINAERVRADTHDGMRLRWQHAVDAARLAAQESGEAAVRRLSVPPAVPPTQ